MPVAIEYGNIIFNLVSSLDTQFGLPILYDVDFSAAAGGQPVFIDASFISLAGSTAPGTLVATVTDSGDHLHYMVAISGMTGDGTVTTSLIDPSTGITVFIPTDNTVTIDDTPPTISAAAASSRTFLRRLSPPSVERALWH
jgi:hypothetical protein